MRLSQADPGNFECPYCKYVSLRLNASRCPRCSGEIGDDFWKTWRANWKAEAKRLLISSDWDGAFTIVTIATGEYPLSQESADLMESWQYTASEMEERRRQSEEARCVFCGELGLPKGADTHQCEKCGRWFCYSCRGNGDIGSTMTRCRDHPPSKDRRGLLSFMFGE